MPASALLSIFVLLAMAAALAFAANLIRKRKAPGHRKPLRGPQTAIPADGSHPSGNAEEAPSDPTRLRSDDWNPHLESAIRGISAPLNAMIGNMELIEQLHMSQEQRKRWKAVRTASDEILKKVSDALDYCNLQSNRPLLLESMDFDACEMVARSIAPFIRKAKSKNIKIHMRSAQFPIFVKNDQIRISQILGHLLENSIQFTKDGYIIVSLENETLAPDHRLLRIVVEDSGIGIPAELHDNIFKPFMSSTGNEEGMGLGLAICKSLCNRLNAKISVSSTPGSGSRFTIEFPCSPSVTANPRNAAYRDALKGRSAIFICAFKEWHDSIIPHLEYWGLKVDAYDDPGHVVLAQVKTASCVVFFGATGQWSAQAENDIIEEATHIIECNESNPIEIKRVGRTILLSCYSLSSLFKAFEHVVSAIKAGTESSYLRPSHATTMPPAHVMEAFRKSLRNSLRNIELSIESGNGAMVIQELHNLSGSFAVSNDPDFSRKCVHLEKRIKMEGLSPCVPDLEELTRLLASHLEHTSRPRIH